MLLEAFPPSFIIYGVYYCSNNCGGHIGCPEIIKFVQYVLDISRTMEKV
jgi:hypothetical protein